MYPRGLIAWLRDLKRKSRYGRRAWVATLVANSEGTEPSHLWGYAQMCLPVFLGAHLIAKPLYLFELI